MEVRLENLIEKIKSEGVDTANKQADDIVVKAKADAAKIIEAAKSEALTIKDNAEKEAEDFKANAEASVKQASRDTVLSLKDKIKSLFDAVLSKQVGAAFDEAFMKDLIVKIVENWSQGKDVSVLAGAIDVEKLKGMVVSELKKDMEIKLDNKITNGFRIGIKGEDLTYDFTDESVLEALKLFLNPKLAELL